MAGFRPWFAFLERQRSLFAVLCFFWLFPPITTSGVFIHCEGALPFAPCKMRPSSSA